MAALLSAILLALSGTGVVLARSLGPADPGADAVATPPAPTVPAPVPAAPTGDPGRVRIPAIGVVPPLVRLGLNPEQTLEQVMDACPNATLVCNWAMVERHTNCFNFPIDRCRWVMHDESFSIGDRTLHAVRPPVFDSPTTRGLFDASTGVCWCVDSFATPLPDPNMAIADLDPDFWRFGMTLFSFGAVSPWLTMVDYDKFGKSVDRVEGLDMTTIAGCHTPVLEGPLIQQALDTTRELPSLTPPPLPDQSILDQIIAALSQPVS